MARAFLVRLSLLGISCFAADAVAQTNVQKSSVQLRPAPGLPVMRRTVILKDLPAATVNLTIPPYWTAASRAGQAQHPREALVVERERERRPFPCDPAFDRIDIRQPLANGFRLLGFTAEPLPPPDGFLVAKPLEAILLPREPTIQVRIPTFSQKLGNALACWSGYRLSIKMEGPTGIEPFSRTADKRPRLR